MRQKDRKASVVRLVFPALCAALSVCAGCGGVGNGSPRSVKICVRVDVDHDRYALVPIRQETDFAFAELFHGFVEECDRSVCDDDASYDSDYYLVETSGGAVVALTTIDMHRSVVQRVPFDRMAPVDFGWLVCGDHSDEPKWAFRGPEISSGICEVICRSANEPLSSRLRTSMSTERTLRDPGMRPGVAASTKTIALPGGAKVEMVQIPGKDYMMGKHEVTQTQWKSVMGDNPSEFEGADNPVDSVSWEDCQEFIKKLNALPDVRNAGLVFRLPTREEWDYASSAGARGIFCKLSDGTEATCNTLADVAWYRDNADDKTHPVGRKKPNAFGLYDMHGNVGEWTQDSFDGYSGGSWLESARGCRSFIGTHANPSVGSGTPRQAWLNYHDERNMNHKQTEM